MSLIISILLSALTLGFTGSEINTASNKQGENCLEKEGFNLVVAHIEEHGKQVTTIDGSPIDEGSLAFEISIGKRFIRLWDYQGDKVIHIFDKSEDNKMTPSRIAVENNKIRISAYYSEFETDESLKRRTKDWCDLVSELTKN